MRKFNLKRAKESVVIIQSLEGTPTLIKRGNSRLVLFNHNQVDQAVKNQLLHGDDEYYVEENYSDIDSTQLRKYFEDQKMLIEYLQANFTSMVMVKSEEELMTKLNI